MTAQTTQTGNAPPLPEPSNPDIPGIDAVPHPDPNAPVPAGQDSDKPTRPSQDRDRT